jgi:DNA-binding NarL/FixJ family response regulator
MEVPFGARSGSPTGVLIVDDHPIVREGLRSALSAHPDINVVGEASDGLDAEEKAAALHPDVIIMDINMPRRNGLEAMLSIKQSMPEVKVLFLTVSESEDDLVRAVRYGSEGYLLKRTDVGTLVDAIRRAVAGEAILSPRMTSMLLRELRDKVESPSLSPRESEILSLIGDGLTTTEIAERLFLSKGSVSTYIRRLLEKLHLRNKSEAMSYYLRHTLSR